MKRLGLVIILLFNLIFLTACGFSTELFMTTVTITFEEEGGSDIQDLVVEKGVSFVPDEMPEKEGYVFDGWYLDEAFLYEASFTAGVNNDITLYAKWIDEDLIFTLEDIRTIINTMLDVEQLTIADQETLEAIVMDIITTGNYLDEETLLDVVLSRLNVVELLEDSIVNTLEETRQAVVLIQAYDTIFGSGANGSGVIYKKEGNMYYVITNHHVIDGYQSGDFAITIFDSKGTYEISRRNTDLIAYSVTHDIAVLRFESNVNFKTLPFADKDDLNVGQFVLAIGSPLDLPDTSTLGIISAIDRPMTYREEGSNTNTITIQHSAPISPGKSGGALINLQGELVGVNFLSYVDETVGEGIEGLHFAIQIDIIIDLLTNWDII